MRNIVVGIVTMVCGAAAPGCIINYKINRRASCKLNPIWYMVLIFDNPDTRNELGCSGTKRI